MAVAGLGPVDIMRRGGRGGRGGRGAGSQAATAGGAERDRPPRASRADRGAELCRAFQKGACRRGEKCPYLHGRAPASKSETARKRQLELEAATVSPTKSSQMQTDLRVAAAAAASSSAGAASVALAEQPALKLEPERAETFELAGPAAAEPSAAAGGTEQSDAMAEIKMEADRRRDAVMAAAQASMEEAEAVRILNPHQMSSCAAPFSDPPSSGSYHRVGTAFPRPFGAGPFRRWTRKIRC